MSERSTSKEAKRYHRKVQSDEVSDSSADNQDIDDSASLCSKASSRMSTRSSLKSLHSSMSSASCKTSVSGSRKDGTSVISSRSRSSLSTTASIDELERRKLEIEAQLKSVEAALEQKQISADGMYQVQRSFAMIPRSSRK